MKIYKKEPESLVRLSIKKTGEKGEKVGYASFCECTSAELVEEFEKFILSLKLSPFPDGSRTQAIFREAQGGKNGRSKSLSFFLNGRYSSAKLMDMFTQWIAD